VSERRKKRLRKKRKKRFSKEQRENTRKLSNEKIFTKSL